MAELIELELSDTRKVLVEVESSDVGKDGFRDLCAEGGTGGRVTRKLSDVAEELKDIMNGIAEKVREAGPGVPDRTTVEMSVNLGTGGALRFLGADARGGIKVTLTWGP